MLVCWAMIHRRQVLTKIKTLRFISWVGFCDAKPNDFSYASERITHPFTPPRRGLFDSPLERGQGCVNNLPYSQNHTTRKFEIPYVYFLLLLFIPLQHLLQEALFPRLILLRTQQDYLSRTLLLLIYQNLLIYQYLF